VDSLVASTAAVHQEAVQLTRQASGAGQVHLTTRRTRKDGSLIDVDLLAAPIRVGDELVGLYALYHDISELQRAREQAEAATQAKSERHLQASAGEIPAFSSLRHAVFEPVPAPAPRQTPRQLKVRVHKATSDGDSEPIGGSIAVQTGGTTRRYDIKLAKGQVTLPLTGATYRVDIEPTEIPDQKAQDHDT
jgi:hypothetical protein